MRQVGALVALGAQAGGRVTAPYSLREAIDDARRRPFQHLRDMAIFATIIAALYLGCYVAGPALFGR
ncbi:MAG: hypothetical protein ACREQ5_17680 [Candidatus Dormibacteria bacterium]